MKKIWFSYKQITQRLKSASAQSMVEFALSLPILLLLVFGIIEFGRMMQAYLALENGARFAVRYAITGSYNAAYCEAAATALEYKYPGISALDPDHNCDLPDSTDPAILEKEAALQDWARLPSIRDAALEGAAGIAWIDDSNISGDYLAYLHNASGLLSANYRGNPSIPGFFSISTCSNRATISSTIFTVNQNPFFFPTTPPNQDAYRFPEYCNEQNMDGTVVKYIDDGGGPGNRVRVVLTYRHNLITPLLSSWWPSVRLTSQREGLVEQYRTSRVTGLTGGIAYAATWTFTPTMTNTPTDTPTPSDTPTSTATFTPSNTPTNTATSTATPLPVYCAGRGSVLRQKFSGITGNSVSNLTNHVNYPQSPDLTDYRTTFEIETNNDNYFGTRMRAYLCPPFTGNYTFYIASDDNSQLWLSTNTNPALASLRASVTSWTSSRQWTKFSSQTSSPVYLTAGTMYYIEALMKEGSGGDNLAVGWTLPGWLSSVTVINGQYLVPVVPEAVVPTGTATIVPTATASRTSTLSPTPNATQTIIAALTQTESYSRTQTRAAARTMTAEVNQTNTAIARTATSIAAQTNTAIARTATSDAARTNTSVAKTLTAQYTPPTPSNTPVPSNTPQPSNTPTRTATCDIPLDLGGCR